MGDEVGPFWMKGWGKEGDSEKRSLRSFCLESCFFKTYKHEWKAADWFMVDVAYWWRRIAMQQVEWLHDWLVIISKMMTDFMICHHFSVVKSCHLDFLPVINLIFSPSSCSVISLFRSGSQMKVLSLFYYWHSFLASCVFMEITSSVSQFGLRVGICLLSWIK